MKKIDGGLCAVQGVMASGIHAGFKKENKDYALIYFPEGATVAGVFTQNLIKAAPVQHGIEQLKQQGDFKAISINSGNANACTGEEGMQNVLKIADLVANELAISSNEVLVSSTGVIGVQMDLSPLEVNIGTAVVSLNEDDSADAATAIMTTDTVMKQLAYECVIGDQIVHFGAMIKGSGMIHPNLGTMLGYITTDIKMPQALLQKALLEASQKTFNRMSVDGDTSTNDTVLLCSTNKVSLDLDDATYEAFVAQLSQICQELAVLIAKDGEGASKFVEVKIHGALTEADAVQLGKTVATSSLVKTAIYGQDANWGRIICAVGYAGVASIDPNTIDISFSNKQGNLLVCKQGMGLNFDETRAKIILSEAEIDIIIDLNIGSADASVWTCDLTEDYIKINADYRS